MQETKQTGAINPAVFLMRVVQGALIGGGAILPGISGGVLSVVFGIYRPMMEFLSHPIKALKKNLWLFVPIIVGVAIGFVGFAKLIDLLFTQDSPYPISLFVGLILGTVPMLWRTAGEKGRGKPEYLTLFISFTLLLVVLAALSSGTRMNVGLTPVWSFISGIVWGFSLVVPGLSSSSILLFFGLYEQIMAAAGNLDMSVIIPLIAGIGVVAVLFARMIDMLFEKHHGIASHAILGLVLASTIMIIPRTYQSVWQALLCLAVAAAGFVVALYMDKWGEKIKPKE
ncbi:MAG: DUF368 domain-containing protein [Christensenellales bacterium]|jgi:putative membrane protein